MPAPHPLLGWDASRAVWLVHRRAGIGASDVATLLGLSPYGDTPWQLWAEKTGAWMRRKDVNEAMEIGTELEPWLIAQAPRLLGQDVTRTPHMLYAHPEHAWRLCSPDAFAADGSLVEAKTAKLATYGDPPGWDNDGVPLGYELQARWQMHVMDRDRVYIVALVAGMGRIHRTIDRVMSVEYDLVTQVSEWRQKHLVQGIEPAVEAADNEALTQRYRIPEEEVIDLDGTDALELSYAYKQARDAETAARKTKEEAGAQLKQLMGKHRLATLGGHLIASWDETRGSVDWKELAREQCEYSGNPAEPERFRKPSTRTLLVK